MKIAVNINEQFKPMTGVQHYVDSLLNALYVVNTSHEITAFAPRLRHLETLDKLSQDGLFNWWRQPNARVDMAGSEFAFKDNPNFKKSRLVWKIANILDGRVVNKIHSRTYNWRTNRASRRYDLMHLPEPFALKAVGRPASRSVVTIYDMTLVTCSWAHNAAGMADWDPYLKFAQHQSARILTISEFSKNDIVEHLRIPADRVDVTPLAPRTSVKRIKDPVILSDTLKKWDLKNTPFVLYAGTLEPRKNLPRLIKAFGRAVQEAHLGEHKLVLAGGNWNHYDFEMRLLALEEGLGGRIITTGYVSNHEMNTLMSACEAFAYVSEYEGFGLPPLEAMTCGAPVIASNATSLPEVVGDAGLQVDPADVEQIAGALHLLLTDCGENARRRELSLARAKEFSWERTAELTLKSYEAASA